ncbi:thioredoxin-2 [[Candida] jaroonii]|uniref:Thioredoxin-2 n=1 Tax=[Candida] jaroonii TaxID=467808 RepID=A0ACA9YG84_9ASCO|nr:thioredoxin-2 [[Candida] jaroonii]
MVNAIATEQEFEEALTHSGLVVVDFFATWCGPCKVIAPMLDKFSKEYESAKFIKVDVDQFGAIAQKYEISSMPTILYFKGGEVVDKVIGANPAGIKQTIAKNV